MTACFISALQPPRQPPPLSFAHSTPGPNIMWKLIVAFAVFAAVAMYMLSKGGDIDISGEKHGIEEPHAASAPASAAASAPASAASQ